MLLDPNLDIQVAGRAAICAGLSVAGRADAHTLINAAGDFYLKRFVGFGLAHTVATHAGFGNQFAAALALGTGLLHAEKALPHLHNSVAVAGGAGHHFRARLGTGTVATVAVIPTRNADLRFLAMGRFFQRDFHGVAKITTAKNLTASALLTAALTIKYIAKNVAKSLRKTAKTFSAWSAPHVGVHACVAILVIGGAFLVVRKHLVGFLGFLEFFFSNLVRRTLVTIRMVLHRKLAVRFFDVFGARVFGNAERVVIVFFGHGRKSQGDLVK